MENSKRKESKLPSMYRRLGRALLLTVLLTVGNFVWGFENALGTKDIILTVLPTQQTVSGTTTDVDGTPLPGVSVVVVGTSDGVVTDFDGNYSIQALPSQTLEFSYIGMRTQRIAMGNQTVINVTMEESVEEMDEVVVIGYGTQVKSKVTAAVTQINSDVLVDRPVTSVAQALSGLDPGVDIRVSASGGGRPGTQPEISIRGEYTVDNRAEGQQPLVLVDGFEANINDVDPNQIETVTVLKDAASTAIYGVRAGAGVILITTKGGGRNRPTTFNYRFAGSVSNVVSVPEVLSTPDFMEFYNLAAVNEERYLVNRDNPDFVTTDFFPVYSQDVINRARNGEFPDTPWRDLAFGQTASLFQHSLDASGGTDKTSYLVSLGFLDQEGINIGQDEFKRYNLRAKIDTDITNWLTVGANIAYTRSEERRVDNSTAARDLRPEPHFPITDEFFGGTGVFVQPANGDTDNALWVSQNGSLFSIDRDVIEMALSARLKIAKGLTFDQKVNYRVVNGLVEDWNDNIPFVTYTFDGQTGEYNLESPGGEPEGPFASNRFLEVRDSRNSHLTTQSLLNYNVTLNDAHSIGLLAGWQTESLNNDYFEASRQGFPSGALQRLDVGDQTNVLNSSGGSLSSQQRFLGAFARLTYDYKERYLVEGSIRHDGTSEFAPGLQWGTFPSIALGWNVAKENFMSSVDFVELLKFRASYGETGNVGGGLAYFQRIAATDGYAWPGGEQGGFRVPGVSDPSLTWETVIKKNIGADLVLWRGKLSFITDFYINQRSQQLGTVRLPRESGFGAFIGQPFSSRTDGYEFAITHRNKIGEFGYNISANVGWAKNVWESRPGDVQWDNSQVGWPIRNPFGHDMDGWISNQAELEEYLDATGFGNGANRNVWIGTPILTDSGQPDPETGERIAGADGIINNFDRELLTNGDEGRYTFGANLGFTYKRLSFSAIIAGQFNRQLVANVGNVFEDGANSYVAIRDLAFDPENPSDDALFPIPITRNLAYPARPIINAEFVRVRNMNLTYDFDTKNILRGLRSLQLYVTAENPFLLWTNSPLAEYGWDPETPLAVGYPINRTTTIGLNIGF
ncbi:MAG: SusC/RagA family TonB-linked outer membrane protein [Bacteroidota bacterium]